MPQPNSSSSSANSLSAAAAGEPRASAWQLPLTVLQNVRRETLEALARIGIRSVGQLLLHFPRAYERLHPNRKIDELVADELQSVAGEIIEVDSRRIRGGGSMIGILIQQENLLLRAVWYHRRFLLQRLKRGDRVVVTGKPKLLGNSWVMNQPEIFWPDADDRLDQSRLVPIYPLTEGITQPVMRRVIKQVTHAFADSAEETLPAKLLSEEKLLSLAQAVRNIHEPPSEEAIREGRRRFVFEEFFALQAALAARRHQISARQQAPALPVDARIDARITRLFPFELTADQRRAVDEIAADMVRNVPMNRLLQGDVGCGKTIVAVYAMLLAVAHGHQAALLAPTEMLARQHATVLEQMLRESRVKMGLLTGSLAAGERKRLTDAIAAGETQIVIGTQAIVQGETRFAKLGLVVIDEQHKFGVVQRAKLRKGDVEPHYLVMTATPIPRTVAMTAFGDLDVSLLRTPPPGRMPVKTYFCPPEKRPGWWEFFGRKLREGRQGFIVAPRIADDESDAAVEPLYESLANGELEAFRLEMLHGRMAPEERDAIMTRFRAGETQALVASSIVEVGIDIPNATLLCIEGADRFGLAQLHQLRGRVSRGTHPGFAALFADDAPPEAVERLERFTKLTDGFEVAELDLKLRGPGEMFGTKQHGLPPFHVADLRRDSDILQEARNAAQRVILSDPKLQGLQWSAVKQTILDRYGKMFSLGDVG